MRSEKEVGKNYNIVTRRAEHFKSNLLANVLLYTVVKSIYDPVTRNKVKTASITVRCKNKDIPMNGEGMYLRLFAINAYKKTYLERIMASEMQQRLSANFVTGKMVTTKKSEFIENFPSLKQC